MIYIGLILYIALIVLFYSSRKLVETPEIIISYSRMIGYSWVIILLYISRILFSSHMSESVEWGISLGTAIIAVVVLIELLRVGRKIR